MVYHFKQPSKDLSTPSLLHQVGSQEWDDLVFQVICYVPVQAWLYLMHLSSIYRLNHPNKVTSLDYVYAPSTSLRNFLNMTLLHLPSKVTSGSPKNPSSEH